MRDYNKLSYEELMKIDVSDIKDYRELDSFLEVLWSEFANVPVDEDGDTIDESFYIWSKGDDECDIWHWFDDRHSKGLAGGIMGLGKSEDVTLNIESLEEVIDRELKDFDERAKNILLKAIKYIFSDGIIGEKLINEAKELNKSLEEHIFDGTIEFIRLKNMTIIDFWNMEDETQFIDYIYS